MSKSVKASSVRESLSLRAWGSAVGTWRVLRSSVFVSVGYGLYQQWEWAFGLKSMHIHVPGTGETGQTECLNLPAGGICLVCMYIYSPVDCHPAQPERQAG